MQQLEAIFLSRTRAEVFRTLFGISNEEYHLRELQRQAGVSVGALQKELKNLLALDLIVRRRDGNRVYFSANRSHPLYPEICSIVNKTCGFQALLSKAFKQTNEASFVFVFGSIARDEQVTDSDLDIMVLGTLGFRRTVEILSGIPERIGREINPHVMPLQEYLDRLKQDEHLIKRVHEGAKIFVKGTQNELETMANQRLA